MAEVLLIQLITVEERSKQRIRRINIRVYQKNRKL